MSAPTPHGVVATLELEPSAVRGRRASGIAAQRCLYITLRREPRRWCVDVTGGPATGAAAPIVERSIVADTLGELRRAVEAELGDSAWRALLHVAGPALEVMAPDIISAPSQRAGARAD